MANADRAAAAILGLTSAQMVAAQGYPTRPVTMIVPFPAGGGSEPLLIVGKKSLPSDDLKGLIGWLKANPDTASVGIAKLNATMVQVLADPQVQKRFAELGIGITPSAQQSTQALRTFQKAEAERWWPIIKASNIKVD